MFKQNHEILCLGVGIDDVHLLSGGQQKYKKKLIFGLDGLRLHMVAVIWSVGRPHMLDVLPVLFDARCMNNSSFNMSPNIVRNRAQTIC